MDRPQGAGKIDSEQKDGRNARQQVAEHALAPQKERRKNQTRDLYIRPGPCQGRNLRRKVFHMHPALLEETPSRRRRFSARVGAFTWYASQPSAPGRQGAPSPLSDANYSSFLFVSGRQGVLLRNERDLDLVFSPSLQHKLPP